MNPPSLLSPPPPPKKNGLELNKPLGGLIEDLQYLVWSCAQVSSAGEFQNNRTMIKFAILSLKPRNHVRILTYRTWAGA